MTFINDKKIRSLDFLRSLAIFLVILSHYPKSQNLDSIYMTIRSYGWIGVDIFFVLSGYLISKNLFEEYKFQGDFSFIRFYIKRAFRILPNYWAVIALYFYLPGFAESAKISPLWKFLFFTQNFDLSFSAFSHAWSLCVEEHFYLILPFSAAFLLKKGNLKLNSIIFILIVFFGIFTRWYIWEVVISPLEVSTEAFIKTYYKYLYYPTYARLDGLLFGVLISTLQVFHPSIWKLFINNSYKISMVGAGLMTLALALFTGEKTLFSTIFGPPILSLGIAFILISTLSSQNFLYNLKLPTSRFFATMAFSMYLTHKATINIVHTILKKYGFNKFDIMTTLTTLLCIVFVSGVLFYFIENPFLNIRKKILSKYRMKDGYSANFTAA